MLVEKTPLLLEVEHSQLRLPFYLLYFFMKHFVDVLLLAKEYSELLNLLFFELDKLGHPLFETLLLLDHYLSLLQ